MKINLIRRLVAEFLGTAMLLAAVVGSGIMAERLAGGNAAVALLANTIATGGILVCIILTFGPISGAHFNPAVSICDAISGGIVWKDAFLYTAVQTLGAMAGVVLANLMFSLPAVLVSTKMRTGPAQWLAEFVATFGLLSVIWGTSRLHKPVIVPFAVAAYITAAYWSTSSTSFANPAVTFARSFSDTFAGISPADVPSFILVQFLAAFAATILFRWLLPKGASPEIMFPHQNL
jgi:glycerol uptake facilitator-like aquaporin